MRFLDKERLKSILLLRDLVSDYLNDKIDFVKFYEELNFELGASFDPFDWNTEDLEESLQKELSLYLKFTGGEFGEDENIIPQKTDWIYGESTEKFGWIDTKKYKALLQYEFSRLRLKELF